jgi:hypothetical protein
MIRIGFKPVPLAPRNRRPGTRIKSKIVPIHCEKENSKFSDFLNGTLLIRKTPEKTKPSHTNPMYQKSLIN